MKLQKIADPTIKLTTFPEITISTSSLTPPKTITEEIITTPDPSRISLQFITSTITVYDTTNVLTSSSTLNTNRPDNILYLDFCPGKPLTIDCSANNKLGYL